MSTVWMRHPDLPPDQLAEVDALAVPHQQAAGWQLAEAPPRRVIRRPGEETSAESAEAPPADPPEDTVTEPAKGRRTPTKKEGDSQ